MIGFWVGAHLCQYLNKAVRRKYDDSNDRVVVFIETEVTFWFPLVVKNVADALGPSWNIHIFTNAATQAFLATQLAGIEYKFTESDRRELTDASLWNDIKEEHVLMARVNSVFAPETTLEEFLKFSFVPVAVTSDGKTCTFHDRPSLWKRSRVLRALESADAERLKTSDVVFFLQNMDPGELPDLETCLKYTKKCMYPTDDEVHAQVVVGNLQQALEDRDLKLRQVREPRRLEHSYDVVFDNIHKCRKHAIFVQCGNPQRLAELHQLLGAKNLADYDLYVSWHTGMDGPMRSFWTTHLSALDAVTIISCDNRGADIGQFLIQLYEVRRKRFKYDHFLKVHTKSDHVWFRELAAFYIEHLATMEATLDESEAANGVAPEKYLLSVKEHVSYAKNEEKLDELTKLVEVPSVDSGSKFVGGTFLYGRFASLERISATACTMYERLVPGYPGLDGQYEHACERLIGMACNPFLTYK